MFNTSQEQQNIIDALIKNKKCVIGDSVAGSGKTTTVFSLAQQNPYLSFFQLTYNKMLREEVSEKAKILSIENLSVHTYHSLIYNFYLKNNEKKMTTDSIMKQIIKTNNRNCFQLPKIDVLIIDEAQDQTLLYFSLTHKFLLDIFTQQKYYPQLLLLGDRYQGIYNYKGSDYRYLTFVDDIYPHHIFQFEHHSLSTSYRLTNQTAEFVNKVLMGENRIKTERNGSPVIYYMDEIDKISKELAYIIKTKIDTGEITANDIFILSSSIKSEFAPYKKLENELCKLEIPCYVPLDEDSPLNDNSIKGKVVFTTFHQSKGRERHTVIVYGFDESFYFYSKNEDKTKCPSALYVACTRAKNQLILIHDTTNDNNHLPFLKIEPDNFSSLDFVELRTCTSDNPYEANLWNEKAKQRKRRQSKQNNEKNKDKEEHNTSVTELIKHIKDDYLIALEELKNQLCERVCEPKTKINIVREVRMSNGLTEDVSDLNGTIIPVMYEWRKIKRNSIYENLVKKSVDKKLENDEFISKKLRVYPSKIEKIEDFTSLCILDFTVRERLYYKIGQIENYNWLKENDIRKCHLILDKEIGARIREMRFEVPILNTNKCNIKSRRFIFEGVTLETEDFGDVNIGARLDAFDNKNVYEFKCVENLQIEHFLQLIFYCYLWNNYMRHLNGSRDFKLMNILTGEMWKIRDVNSPLIAEVINILLFNKYNLVTDISDAEFLMNCSKEVDCFYNPNIIEKSKNIPATRFMLDDSD